MVEIKFDKKDLRLSKPPPVLRQLLHYDIACCVSLRKYEKTFDDHMFSTEPYFYLLMTHTTSKGDDIYKIRGNNCFFSEY